MADTNASIFQQIETKADFYPPNVYAGLLTYYSNLSLERDSLDSQFTPLSAVDRRGRNPKLFVIGILPPSSNVTGRLLDRSATSGTTTIQNVSPTVVENPAPLPIQDNAGANASQVTLGPYQIPIGTGPTNVGQVRQTDGVGPDKGPPIKTQMSIPQIWKTMRDAYVQVTGREPTATELQFYVAQSLRETGGSWPNNNVGFVGNYGGGAPLTPPEKRPGPPTRTIPAGVTTFRQPPPDSNLYKSYASPQEGAKAYLSFLTKNPATIQAAQQGDTLGFLTGLAQQGYYEASVDVYYRGTQKSGPEPLYPTLLNRVANTMVTQGVSLGVADPAPLHAPDALAYKESSGAYIARAGVKGNRPLPPIHRFNPGSPYGPGDLLPPGTGTPQVNASWVSDGSPAAMESRKNLSKIATTQITVTTDLGKRFQDAQRAQILATQKALENMRNTPPLRMLVNPSSFTVSAEKITSDGNWGRNGPIIEHWGDQQDKISGSGSVAGFYALAKSLKDPKAVGAPGLTRMARNFSLGYQNFLSLYLLYRNNAGLYLNDMGQSDKRLNLSMVGSVYIYYDNTLYIGSFDSFNVTEDDTKPFTLNYSFEFTVRSTFLLDNPPVQGTGNNNTFALNNTTSAFLPAGGGDILGGQVTLSPEDEVTPNVIDLGDIDQLVNHNVIDLGDIDVLVASSPQKPGNESGAKLTKQRIQAEISLTEQDFRIGTIDRNTYLSTLSDLNSQLALAT